MTDLYEIATILSGFALAGLVGCIMNIRKAMVVGMGVAWLIIMVLFFLSLSQLNSATIVSDFVMKSGMSFVTVVLVGFYLFCVMKNREFVEDGLMPDAWYTFSYFVVICTGVNVLSMVRYFENRESFWNSMMMLSNTLLFAFIVVEWIICTFYRTDGFTV